MDATTALLVQGCACAPAAHPAVTRAAAVTSGANSDAGVLVACDAAPYVEFDTVLAQMAGQLQTTEPRHGAELPASTESGKRTGHGARAIRADAEMDTQPVGDDDDGDGDEDTEGLGPIALRQMMMMPAGPAVPAPIQTPTLRWSVQDQNRLRTIGTEELMIAEPEQFAGDRSVDRRDRMSQGPEGAQTAVDQANDSTVDLGRGSRVMAAISAERTPVRELGTVSVERPEGDTARTAPPAGRARTDARVEPKNAYTSARVGRDVPARNGFPQSTGMPTTEPGLAPREQEHTVAALQEREAAQPEAQMTVLPDVRGTADTDENAPVAPEGLTTAGRSSRAAGRAPADKAPVRGTVTVGTERPADGEAHTPPQAEPKNAHASVRVGRGEPTRQERSTARSGGRTVVLSDMRGTTDPDGSMRVASDRPTAVATEEPVTAESEQLAEAGLTRAQSADEQGRVLQQPGDRTLALADTRVPRPEGVHVAADETNGPTVGQGGYATGEPPAGKVTVRESATVSTERPVDGEAHTPPQVEPKNAHASVWVGRDVPARNGFSQSTGMPTTKLGLEPHVQERTVVFPDMRGTADSDESGQGRMPQQPSDCLPASADARVSQPEDDHIPVDQTNGSMAGQSNRAAGRTPADKVTVRESVTVSRKRPVGDGGRTDGHTEPKNMHISARAGRDEPALNGSRETVDVPVTEPGTAPRVQGHTASAVQERETARPEGVRMAADEKNANAPARVGRDEPVDVPVTEPGIAPEAVDITHGKAAEADTAGSRQVALRPTTPGREDAMTASRAVTASRGWPEALVRHPNLSDPLWDEGSQRAGRRESESNARPNLAAVAGPTHTMIPAEGPEVSQTSQAARPALTESAGSSVTRQIAAHVSARAAQGGGEFRARLVPEHLGSVQIRVRVVRGVCTADIRADDLEVARYIEEHSSDLKVSLAEHGIDLSGLSVSSRSRAQEGWGAATLSHSESHWSAHSWNGANARQQYAGAAFAGGNWRDGRGERRGALMESGVGVADSHSAVRQSGNPSPNEPIAARWLRGHARIDYLA